MFKTVAYALLIVLAALAPTSPCAAAEDSLAAYASAQDSARLADGRTIHIVCMGKGSPVVILTAGAGDWGFTWDKVQPRIAEKTRVCAWDRAGFGLSFPAPRPQTVDQRTTDLQDALKTSGIEGPYVLVGHSLGSYESLVFKDREPRNVTGMVLVDPSYPGQFDALERIAPLTIAWLVSQASPSINFFRTCAADVRAGAVWKGKPDPKGCMKPPRPGTLPAELRVALDNAQIEAGPESYANLFDTQTALQSMLLLKVDSSLVMKPSRGYGDMPLVVLTAGEDDSLPRGAPTKAVAETPKRSAQWRSEHEALASLSTRGVNRSVAGSSHFIQQLKPQAVIDAVNEVVDQARQTNH
jgi:pimeloyl-ACP methyl ester carboxylesterase